MVLDLTRARTRANPHKNAFALRLFALHPFALLTLHLVHLVMCGFDL